MYMVKKMEIKASMTVEAALLCPFLCLVLCGMLWFTLQLYGQVDAFAKTLTTPQQKMFHSMELIRLEAVAEDLF